MLIKMQTTWKCLAADTYIDLMQLQHKERPLNQQAMFGMHVWTFDGIDKMKDVNWSNGSPHLL